MSAPTITSRPLAESTPAPRSGLMPLVLRLHFYAGVLIGPFLLLAAVTGLLYTLAPQLDRVLYGQELRAGQPSGPALPVLEQVASAQERYPALTVGSVELSDDPGATTRIEMTDPALPGGEQRSVYVDPYDAQVRGSLVTFFGSTPATVWVSALHKNLHLGAVGRFYSELAASWLWVVTLGGLVLWLRRRRQQRGLAKARRVLLPDLSARGRRRTLSWHGPTGLALTVVLLFLSVTGLTWSRFAGQNFSFALTSLGATAPELDTALPGGMVRSVDTASVDAVVGIARGAGLTGPLSVSPPSDGGAWTVSQSDSTWPVRKDQVAIDPVAGAVTARADFADRPLLSKASSLGISAHMGLLFGLANRVLLALTAVGLICLVVWGYRAWWQRRPTAAGRWSAGHPPARGGLRRVGAPALAVLAAAAVVGWAVPLLGASLVVFLLLDVAIGALRRRSEPPLVEQLQDRALEKA